VLYLLTLGDKNSQKTDLDICKDLVTQLRKREEESHEQKKTSQQRLTDGS